MVEINWIHFNNWKFPVGTKIKFKNEKQKYTVRASNAFFSICTKPYNPKKTVFYAIVDITNKIRWPENLVFGMWAETEKDCLEMLERLTQGESEVSYRNRIPLDLESVQFPCQRCGKICEPVNFDCEKCKISKI